MGAKVNVFTGKEAKSYRQHIPTSRSMGSGVMTHKPSVKEFSPPTITNQWAMVQASRDITAYDDFSISPVRCGEGKYTELFFGFSKDDFQSCSTMDVPVSYRWFPHAVERTAVINGLEASSCLSLSTAHDALQMNVRLKNAASQPITFDLFVKTLFGLNCSASRVSYDEAINAFLCHDLTDAGAFAMQSVDKKPHGYGKYANWEAWYHNVFYRHYNGATVVNGEESEFASYGTFYYKITLAPDEVWEINFIHAMGEDEATVRREHQLVREHFSAQLTASEQNWDAEIRAAFTPGNDRFSGHLPVLQSADPNLKRLYDMSVMALLLMKRTRRMGGRAKVYSTAMPWWTHCFLWDTQMSAYVLALLDPETLKQMIEFWIVKDPSTFMATNYVTGEGEAVWYAVNDFAMSYMICSYVSVTGDHNWLEKTIEGKKVLEHYVKFSTRFLERMEEDCLVNYGESRNLLECVFSYAFKVPAFNATNVWSLRRLADLLEKLGQTGQAAKYREIAANITASVLSLYAPGKGYWNCKYPHGGMVPVRTCLDFNYLFLAMTEDLPEQVKEEMIQFYKAELMTETWMHALSPLDPDTKNSSRTDHQDDGAFASWPAFGIIGLLRTNHVSDALDWIGMGRDKGLATVTKQGPWGQAYFHGGEGSLLEFGAAMKAPKEYPFIERFAVLAGSMFASVLIEDLFGLKADWNGLSTDLPVCDGELEDAPVDSKFSASLYNLKIQNKTVHAIWSCN